MATHPLVAFGELLDRELGLAELLHALMARITRAMRADRGTVYLLDRHRGELFSKVADLPELDEIRLALGQGVAGHVAATGEAVNVPTTIKDSRFFGGVDEKTGYRTQSILAVPMRDSLGELIGVVQVLNKHQGHFTRDDELMLSSLAAQAAAAVQATTLYASLFGDSPGPDKASLGDGFNRILGESEPMRAAYRLTTRAARSEATVLIHGESGTGKELFARAVHVNSGRCDAPLIKVDCGALPPSLIENELFGHERGAFTGADAHALGKLDAADGGTLFLDEIGELPLTAQSRLLRVLQDKSFVRVGGLKTIEVDARVVAATNRDLEAMVAAGEFRADLYYRIRVVDIRLPTLRERGEEDLVRLAQHFFLNACRRHRRESLALSGGAWDRLKGYRWPGNVRELEHCIESAVVICEGERFVEARDLPLPEQSLSAPQADSELDKSGPSNGGPGPGAAPAPAPSEGAFSISSTPPGQAIAGDAAPEALRLSVVERHHILRVMALCKGNQSRAAKLLGIGRATLLRKLAAYKASPE